MVKCMECGKPTSSSKEFYCYKHREMKSTVVERKSFSWKPWFFVGVIIFCISVGAWYWLFGGRGWVETNLLPPQIQEKANLETLRLISPQSLNIVNLIPLLLAGGIIIAIVNSVVIRSRD